MKVIGIVGWKNSGKTGLVERLVGALVARGLRVATVKHAHHNFDLDQPGRDSFRHRAAGASQVALVSDQRWALMTELHGDPEPTLKAMLARLDPVDLVVVEGFKAADIPKIEAHRRAVGQSLLAREDRRIVAVASDGNVDAPVPVVALDDVEAVLEIALREARADAV